MAAATSNPLMSPGEMVPEMALPCSDGTTRWISDLLADGPLVLFVVEHVNSPSASEQARAYEDLAEDFAAVGVRAVGLSPDRIIDQAAFVRANGLTMPILSDPTGMVCGVFGALNGKGAHRAAFLVDRCGTVRGTISGHAAKRQAGVVLAQARERRWASRSA